MDRILTRAGPIPFFFLVGGGGPLCWVFDAEQTFSRVGTSL